MATGSGVGATVLTALKAHLAAVAIGATVVVGGGAAAAAVATGAIHPAAQASAAQSGKTPGAQATHAATQGETARANACDKNGDAKRMASVYANMFQSGGSGTSAEQTALHDICALFVGTDGHAVGFGEIRQALDIAAAIETRTAANASASNCLTAGRTDGKPEGTPGASQSASAGQPSFTAPTADEATTTGLVKSIFDKVSHGAPLEQLARACGVPSVPGTAGSGGSGDNGGGNGKPTGTPGARPTGTPGAGHP
ncbi:MAG TPA: hypothetical protein VLJ14_05135 [Ktedonobacterales bacterium]|nr:hypothetical protein [Ktedonobacterales bacterium]